MGELTSGNADIAAFPLSLTLPRPTYVGLSYSYLNGGIGILVSSRLHAAACPFFCMSCAPFLIAACSSARSADQCLLRTIACFKTLLTGKCNSLQVSARRQSADALAFLRPFAWQLWLAIVASMLSVAIMFWVLSRLSPLGRFEVTPAHPHNSGSMHVSFLDHRMSAAAAL